MGAGDGTEEGDVLDLLSRLVDKSMVVAEARAAGVEMLHATSLRYRMLEPARQYGLERLEESGEAEQVREQYARHYLALAEEAEPQIMMGPEQGAWLQRLAREHDNCRSALSWALGPEDAEPRGLAELGLRLAAALGRGRFWVAYGMSEGLGWLESALCRCLRHSAALLAGEGPKRGWLDSALARRPRKSNDPARRGLDPR